jgi:hypothetical protein
MAFPDTLTNAVDRVTPIVASHLNNLEAKVGVDGSTVITSLDYLLKNAASIEPGHKHSKLWASDGSLQVVDVDTAGKVSLGKQIWVGEPKYGTTFQDIITAIGSTACTLNVSGGTHSITTDLTIPSNINLRVYQGAVLAIADTKTLTINGPIEAGPYQIFSWSGTGKINLRSCPTKNCYLQWWGAQEGLGNDITPALLKAYQSLDVVYVSSPLTTKGHDIIVTSGLWRIATPFEYIPASGWTASNHWLPNLVGESENDSCFYIDLGNTSHDAITIGGGDNGQRWILGTWIKNISIIGPANCCRHALYLACWNVQGGTEKVSLACGSADSAVFITSPENCSWDFTIGVRGQKYNSYIGNPYAGVQFAPVSGVGFEHGGGTQNYVKIHKTMLSGCVYALKLDTSWDIKADAYDIEACSGGEVQSNYIMGLGTNPVKLYSGGITKIGQTFTLTKSTEIDNVGFFNSYPEGNPTGVVTCSIYNTSGGLPTGSPIYTSWKTYNMGEICGNAYTYFRTSRITLPAGTYFVSEEFNGGDANNYISIFTNTNPVQGNPNSACYTYSGGAWQAQSYNIGHFINARGAIWITGGGNGDINTRHLEANYRDIVIDRTNSWAIHNGGGQIEISRSYNVELLGPSEYSRIITDSYSSVRLPSNYSIGMLDAMQDAGSSNFDGNLTMWTSGIGIPVNVKGNGYENLMPNTLLDRWQATKPDGGWDIGDATFTKSGKGIAPPNDVRHLLAPYCAKITYANAGQTNWYFGRLQNELLNICKGKWVCWSIYMMFPSGQTFTNAQNWAPSLTIPAWTSATQYNVGDAVPTTTGVAICVEPGISGSGSAPSWPNAWTLDYTVDGTVVWLNCSPWQGKMLSSAVSDNAWRRISVSMYIPTNATDAYYYWQWYPQVGPTTSTAYIALPMLNFGRMPGLAPAPVAQVPITGSLVMGANHVDSDAYIPTNASSKLYGLYAAKGDVCWSTAVVPAGSPGWVCTTSGINGTNSVWKAMPNVSG